METIYTGNLGQKLFLYTSDNFIYLRSAIGADISRPILLGSDYRDGLSSTVFQDSIHFTYINFHGDLHIRNILDSQILFRLSSEDSPDYTSPHLITFQDKLLLFYFIKNPLNESYLLRAVYPLEEAQVNWSPILFSTFPHIEFLNLGNNLIMACQEDNHASFYRISVNCSYESVQILSVSDIKAQTEALLQPKDKLIENIKIQYEELRNTAIAYKDEATKWYNKYSSQKESV